MAVDPGTATIIGSGIGAASSLFGGLMGSADQEKYFKRQLKAQKEFAQHGIRWKVADARAAGISPLVALGASTTSPSFNNLGGAMGRAVSEAGARAGEGLSNAAMQRMQVANEQVRLQNESDVAQSQAELNRAQADAVTSQMLADSLQARTAQRQGNDAGVPVPGEIPSASKQTLIDRAQEIAPDQIAMALGFGPAGVLKWKKSGRSSPAEAFEQAYGEGGALLAGLIALADDLYHNTGEQIYDLIPLLMKSMMSTDRGNWKPGPGGSGPISP